MCSIAAINKPNKAAYIQMEKERGERKKDGYKNRQQMTEKNRRQIKTDSQIKRCTETVVAFTD